METLDLVKDAKAASGCSPSSSRTSSGSNRLVTDISNASRLDAELSREDPRDVDLAHLLFEICALYEASAAKASRTSATSIRTSSSR